MISIVIPLYNKEKVIEKTLQSVINQTYNDYELIIVDDGSRDSSLKIAKQFLENNSNYIEEHKVLFIEKENGGVSSARNRGVKASNSSYVAFLDADDIWDSNYLSVMNDLIHRYPQCDVYASSFKIITNSHVTNNIANDIGFDEKDGIIDDYLATASTRHPFCASSVVVNKEALNNVGGFPEGIKFGEDLIVWAKMSLNGDFAYTKDVLASYNQTSEASANSPTYFMLPIKDDYVGNELLKLKKTYNTRGLNNYIFIWFKIRFMMSVSRLERLNAFKEFCRMLPRSIFNLDCCFHLLILILPNAMIISMMRWADNYKKKLHNNR